MMGEEKQNIQISKKNCIRDQLNAIRDQLRGSRNIQSFALIQALYSFCYI